MTDAPAGYGGPVLIDNSAWARIGLDRLADRDVARWEEAVRRDQVAVCPPFALEARYSARDPADFQRLAAELAGFRTAVADERTWPLALQAQAELGAAAAVSHRVKPIDLLVGAIAHQHGLGVLHYDHDYDTIDQHTSVRFSSVWVAPRGTIA